MIRRAPRCTLCRRADHTAARCPDAPQRAPRATNARSQQAARWLTRQSSGGFPAAAAQFQITHQAVSQAWHRLFGDRLTPDQTIMVARAERVTSRAAAGATDVEIAAETGLTAEQVRRICARRDVAVKRVSTHETRRARAELAAVEVRRGASLVDAALDYQISRALLERTIKAMGIKPSVNPRARRDGRLARALRRMDDGATPSEAARLERCAPSGIYKELRKRRERAA